MEKNNEKICNHSSSKKQIETRIINEIKVEVEVCKECNQVILKPDDAQRLLKHRSMDKKYLSPVDVILTLLGVFPNRPIINRIVIMKQTFLMEKEIAKDSFWVKKTKGCAQCLL